MRNLSVAVGAPLPTHPPHQHPHRQQQQPQPPHQQQNQQQQQQRRDFTSTPPIQKIHSINSDLSEEAMRTIIDAELQKMDDEKLRREYRDWKPGQRKRPLVVSRRLEDFEEEASGATRWSLRDKRCGALAIKLGMMPVWDGWGERHPCTVLHLDSNVVIRNKTSDGFGAEGYDAVEIGAGERKSKNVTKPLMGHYAKFGVSEHPPWIVREFRVTTRDAMPEPGTRIHARHFVPGQNVDVSGTTKGKGFQGGMKRHGFKGMPASHGTSRSHRAIGSTVSLFSFLLSSFLHIHVGIYLANHTSPRGEGKMIIFLYTSL
jgi:large subunit ribosomal protein L3